MKKPSRLWQLFKQSQMPRLALFFLFISATIQSVLFVVESYLFGVVIDSASLGIKEVLIPVLAIVFITVGEYITIIFTTYFSNMTLEIGLTNIRKKVAQKSTTIDIETLNNSQTGDLMSRTMGDLNGLTNFWLQVVIGFYCNLIMFLIGLAICINVSLWLSLLGFIFIPITFFLSLKQSRPLEKYSAISRKEQGNANSLLKNILSGVITIKTFFLQTQMQEKFSKALENFIKAETRLGKLQAFMEPLSGLLYFLPTISIMLGGGYLIVNNQLTAGKYIVFIFTFGFVSSILVNIKQYLIGFRSGEASAERVCQLLELKSEETFAVKNSVSTSDIMISIKNLSFSYHGQAEKVALKNINLEVKRGETIALVGASGCGKSTLVKVLCGLYKVQTGSVEIDSVEMCAENMPTIRNKISVVAQDNFLFPDTILNNILYGNKTGLMTGSNEEVYQACKNAGIHDFIMSLPNQYDSVIGEKGCTLSGGQRQRICIARAFLRNSEILILDEPTSSLDALTESYLQQTLQELMKSKTVITIAHRLSTIKNADRILVIQDGQIIETGTHRELLENRGVYFNLFTNKEAARCQV